MVKQESQVVEGEIEYAMVIVNQQVEVSWHHVDKASVVDMWQGQGAVEHSVACWFELPLVYLGVWWWQFDDGSKAEGSDFIFIFLL